jgi:hypothetical protein
VRKKLVPRKITKPIAARTIRRVRMENRDIASPFLACAVDLNAIDVEGPDRACALRRAHR